MIGGIIMDAFIDSIIMGILNPIMSFFGWLLSLIFSSTASTLIFGFIFMNLIGFLMMCLDKKYAKEDKRRIPESTLFLTAILFGSLGVLLGMRKFRHKTLHKKFTIGIPLIILVQIIFIIYSLITGLLF